MPCVLSRGEYRNTVLWILILNTFLLHFIKSFYRLGRNFWSLCHIQCTLVLEVMCVWLFSHPCNYCAWTHSHFSFGFVLFCWEKRSNNTLTHGCFRLWWCRGRRWTWMKMDGVGFQREWWAVGGWLVSPCRQTPIAPVPPSPASPSAPSGCLCHVPDARPDSINTELLIWIYRNYNTQHYL